MSDPRREPTSSKLLAAWPVKLRLAGASVAVLTVGLLAAPDGPPRTSQVEERANPLIEAKVAANAPPPATFDGVHAAAEGPRAHVVALLPLGADHGAGLVRDVAPSGARRYGAGVAVSEGYVLTHAAALEGRLAVRLMTASRTVSDAVVAGYDVATGLVLLRTVPGVATPAVLASATPPVGALAVGVAVDDAGPLALPVFVSAVRDDRYLVTGHQAVPGLPIFSLSGALLGVTSGGTANEVVRATGLVDRLIARAATGDVPRTFGLSLQRLAPPLTQVYGDRGLLVADVVPEGPAASAGLAPGDVLLAVNGVEVGSVAEADAALETAASAAEAPMRVRRGGREREFVLASRSAYVVAHLAEMATATQDDVSRAALLPPSLLDRSGVHLRARLLDVNGQPATSRAAVDRAIAASGRLTVLRVRDDRGAYFVAVETAR